MPSAEPGTGKMKAMKTESFLKGLTGRKDHMRLFACQNEMDARVTKEQKASLQFREIKSFFKVNCKDYQALKKKNLIANPLIKKISLLHKRENDTNAENTYLWHTMGLA